MNNNPLIASHIQTVFRYLQLFCFFFSFLKKLLSIYLFLAALGLHCCTWAFSSCGEQGLLFIAVRGLLCGGVSCYGAQALGAQTSVVAAHRLSSCGARA